MLEAVLKDPEINRATRRWKWIDPKQLGPRSRRAHSVDRRLIHFKTYEMARFTGEKRQTAPAPEAHLAYGLPGELHVRCAQPTPQRTDLERANPWVEMATLFGVAGVVIDA